MTPQAALCCFLCLLLLSAANARRVPDCRHSAKTVRPSTPPLDAVHGVKNILGGWQAPTDRFPYVCLIGYIGEDGPAICGGILVASQWVMTAAHCLYKKDGVHEIKEIACGIHRPVDASKSHMYKSSDVRIHEMYNPEKTKLRYDIAMVKLDRESDIDRPLLGDSKSALDEATVYTVGWGEFDNPGELSDDLRITKMLTVDNEQCKESWIDKFDSIVVDEDRVCAGGTDGRICYGDSGGPLLIAHSPDGAYGEGSPSEDVVVGITSFGECKGETPSVFTRVSHFREWIDEVVEDFSSSES